MNIAGYFNQRASAPLTARNMPQKRNSDTNFVFPEDTPSAPLRKKAERDSEATEEEKRPENGSSIVPRGTNEELFHHLTYLSQLSNDVAKH